MKFTLDSKIAFKLTKGGRQYLRGYFRNTFNPLKPDEEGYSFGTLRELMRIFGGHISLEPVEDEFILCEDESPILAEKIIDNMPGIEKIPVNSNGRPYSLPIAFLDALERNRIDTFGDLVEITPKRFVKDNPGVGRQTRYRIQVFLSANGVEWE